MKLNNLQILRGISALLVCCFHFRRDLDLTINGINIGEFLFNKGSVGVPIFFVISGFIMAFTTQNIIFNKENLTNQLILFYKKRIIRIVPLYYLLTLLWFVIGGNNLLFPFISTIPKLLKSLLFLPQQDLLPILFVGWSLNYEIFFYLLFGISFIFISKRHVFIITVLALSSTLGFFVKFENPFLQMVTNYLNLHFVSGILLALFFKNYNVSRKYASIVISVGILLFILMILKLIPYQHELISLFIVSLFVLSFLLLDFSLKIKGSRFLIFLGDISYSLYLSHPFVEIFFRHFKVEGYLNIPYLIFKIFVVIFVAGVLYYFVEKKLTDYLKLKLKA